MKYHLSIINHAVYGAVCFQRDYQHIILVLCLSVDSFAYKWNSRDMTRHNCSDLGRPKWQKNLVLQWQVISNPVINFCCEGTISTYDLFYTCTLIIGAIISNVSESRKLCLELTAHVHIISVYMICFGILLLFYVFTLFAPANITLKCTGMWLWDVGYVPSHPAIDPIHFESMQRSNID